MTAGLMLADLLLAASPARLKLTVVPPQALGLARPADLRIELAFQGAAPERLGLAVGANARLAARPARQSVRLDAGRATASVTLDPLRRGEGRLDGLWARW